MVDIEEKEISPKSETNNIKFNADTEKILHMVTHSIYKEREVFIRELISNAADALEKLRFLSITKPGLTGENHKACIDIQTSLKNKTFQIRDSGLGMSKEDLMKNLGTIAKSGSEQFSNKLKESEAKDLSLIGQFGIGFYSCFMVAKKVVVISKKAGLKTANQWSSDGKGTFSITEYKGEFPDNGTLITLYMNDNETQFLDKHKVKHIIKSYSNHLSVPISYTDLDEEKVESPEKTEGENKETQEESNIINDSNALWCRDKKDITPEEYKAFYAKISHAADDPLAIMHNKVEGQIAFNSLIYIPSKRPFDLFSQERKAKTHLYCEKVFITEDNVQLHPAHLRFVRGVVDSPDLPLNIDRESLQNNIVIQKIKDAITKKIYAKIKDFIKKDPEKFEVFWKEFGEAFKEGLCDHAEDRDTILSICRFHTSKTGKDKFISLDQYLENMKDNQDTIYFANGNSYESIMQNSKIEGFLSRDIEVLILTNHVDDFWVNVVTSFKDKPLLSATRSNIDITKFDKKDESSDTENKDSKTDNKTESEEAEKEKFKPVLDFFRDTLKPHNISDVIISKKLTHSPACISVSDQAMDIRMERFLIAQKQLNSPNAKILEININNPIFQAFSKDILNKEKEATNKAIVMLIFNQARISEGDDIINVKEFFDTINNLIVSSHK